MIIKSLNTNFKQAILYLNFLACFAFISHKCIGQTTPPVIQWQYTNVPQFTNAPSYKFANPYYTPNNTKAGENWFYDITPTSDGGYIACGYAETSPNHVEEPIMAKLDAGGNLIWEQIYDGGDPNDDGYFWRVIESKDPNGNPIYVALGSKTNYEIFMAAVDAATGNENVTIGGPYYFYYWEGSLTRSATLIPQQTSGISANRNNFKAVYNPGGSLNGYIICGGTGDGNPLYQNTNYPNPNGIFLLKLDPYLNFDNTFNPVAGQPSGVAGIQIYNFPTVVRHITQYFAPTPKEMDVINNGTTNPEYIVTGWLDHSITYYSDASGDDEIYLLETDAIGRKQWDNSYSHATIQAAGYVNNERMMTNENITFPTPYHKDWGMNVIWKPGSPGTLYLNAECDENENFDNVGGTYFSQANPSATHADSYLTFSDALLAIDPNTGNLLSLQNVAPFDGIDFFPRIAQTPDGGIVVAGNRSYTAPGFPSPQQSVSSAPSPYNTQYNTQLNTLMGVNVELVKFDPTVTHIQWDQQYLQSQGTYNNPSAPPGAAVTCEWGLAVTPDGGFVVCGNNELNDEDYSAMKLQFVAGTTGVSQIPGTYPAAQPLLDNVIPTGSPTIWNTNMIIEGVVDVPSGATLDITGSNTVIQFANRIETGITSKIVVERGGKLIIENGATVTGLTSSVNSLWDGIEVWGNPNGTSQTGAGSVIVKSGATVSHMNINGIYNIKNDPENVADWSYTGSIIQANGANFTDNERAIQLLYYHSSNPNYNIDYFENCNFTTTNSPPTGFGFSAFVSMYDVHVINFAGDNFQNLTAYPVNPQSQTRGAGIYSIDATYIVKPYGTTPCNFSGLNYSIYATSPLHYPVYIDGNATTQNIFTDNVSDVYAGSTTFSTIENNNFTKDFLLRNVFPLSGYNLYLDGSNGYEVQSNNFSAAPTSPANIYGTVVNNSTTTSCQINNNTYSGSLNGNMAVGTQAQGNNGNSGSGLLYNCNTYNYPIPVADIGITSGSSIFSFQGIGSSPEGNSFSQTCLTGDNNINDVNYPLFYTYSTSSLSYNPNEFGTCVTPVVTVVSSPTQQNCLLPCIPCQTIGTLRNTQEQYRHIRDSLSAILAAGDAPSLYSIISTGTPGQIENALLAPGPYLSDSVLIAAINKNLSPGIIKNILIPNSPLDSTVMVALNNVSLPPGIKKNINNAQIGTSARTELQQAIAFYNNEVGLATNALASFFMQDTIQGAIDSAIAVIQPELTSGSCDQLMPLAALQSSTGQITSADSTISAIQSMGGSTYNNFCTLLPIIIKLQSQPNHYFALLTDTADAKTVEQIAMDSTKPGYVEARAIMTLVFNKQYAATILPLPLNHNHRAHKIIGQNNDSSENNEANNFMLYPNPASSQITIETSITDGQSGYIYFYNMLGENILSDEIKNSITICNIAKLSQGMYFYRMEVPGKTSVFGKLIIIR